MKKVWMCAIVAGCGIAMLGAQARAQDAANDATASQDKQFCQAAGEGGLFEVQMGHVAEQKSNNDGVKAFGAKMVHDHSQLNDEMKPTCGALGVSAPEHLDSKDQATYDHLSSLSGKEFDQEYIKTMVMDHRHDLRAFRHEETTTSDSELKQKVSAGVSVITEHLHIVTELAQKNGVDVPMRGAAQQPPPA
jgi:putative membrane protein